MGKGFVDCFVGDFDTCGNVEIVILGIIEGSHIGFDDIGNIDIVAGV